MGSAADKPEGCPAVSVVICTLNEAENLSHVLPKIPRWIDEILLLDGHSTDGTMEVAKKLCPDITVLYQTGKGKGNALKYGIERAIGEIVVALDADGETDPVDIPRFIEPLLHGFDFAKGSRFFNSKPNMSFFRRLGNQVLVSTTNILYGTKYTDVCSGYNAFWKKSIQKVPLSSDGFEMEQEMNVRIKKTGLKVIEVQCHDIGRIKGISKTQAVKQGIIDLLIIIRERFRD